MAKIKVLSTIDIITYHDVPDNIDLNTMVDVANAMATRTITKNLKCLDHNIHDSYRVYDNDDNEIMEVL